MREKVKYDYSISQSEVDDSIEHFQELINSEFNESFDEYLLSDEYQTIKLNEQKEKKLLKLLDKYQFKGSLKSTMLFYCSKLIPLLDKDEKELKEVSMDDLNAQREHWDNMKENLQDQMNNALSPAKERLRSMIKAAIIQREKLKVIKGTKQKPINIHMKPIAFHLHWLAGYQQANIVDFIYDLYFTFEYENYGKRYKDYSIFINLTKAEQKKEQNALRREGKRLIYDWYKSTFDELELP